MAIDHIRDERRDGLTAYCGIYWTDEMSEALVLDQGPECQACRRALKSYLREDAQDHKVAP